MKTNSRWIPIYILLGIYAFWTLLFLLLLKLRSLTSKASPSDRVEVEMVYNPLHSQPNPLHSNRSNRSVDINQMPDSVMKERMYNSGDSIHNGQITDSPV